MTTKITNKIIIIHFINIIVVLFGCSNVKREFKNIGSPLNKQQERIAIETINADSSKFTLLFFISGFNEEYTIKNGKIKIYDGKLKSDPSTGLAKVIKVNNEFHVMIKNKDSDFSFTINRRRLKRYKYVYIKHLSNKIKPYYKIIFSHTPTKFK